MQNRSYASYMSSHFIRAHFAISDGLTTLNLGVHTTRLQKYQCQVDILNNQQHIDLLIDCQNGVIRDSHALLHIDVLNLPVVKFTSCCLFCLLLFYFLLHKSFQALLNTQAVYVMQRRTCPRCSYAVISDTMILRID